MYVWRGVTLILPEKMKKKKIIIPIAIVIALAAIVTFVILLIPHTTTWKGTYKCYNLESLSKDFNGSDLASSVLDYTDIKCDFEFVSNIISYRGKGTIEYNDHEYPLSYIHTNNDYENRPYLFLSNSTGLFQKTMYFTKDVQCFLIDEIDEGFWIVFSGNEPTVEEVRSRVAELKYDWLLGIE